MTNNDRPTAAESGGLIASLQAAPQASFRDSFIAAWRAAFV
jgi:hypothetical protein